MGNKKQDPGSEPQLFRWPSWSLEQVLSESAFPSRHQLLSYEQAGSCLLSSPPPLISNDPDKLSKYLWNELHLFDEQTFWLTHPPRFTSASSFMEHAESPSWPPLEAGQGNRPLDSNQGLHLGGSLWCPVCCRSSLWADISKGMWLKGAGTQTPKSQSALLGCWKENSWEQLTFHWGHLNSRFL